MKIEVNSEDMNNNHVGYLTSKIIDYKKMIVSAREKIEKIDKILSSKAQLYSDYNKPTLVYEFKIAGKRDIEKVSISYLNRQDFAEYHLNGERNLQYGRINVLESKILKAEALILQNIKNI